MTKRDLSQLHKVAKERAAKMSRSDKEAQRRSFAFGNGAIENDAITRKSVDRAAKKLELKNRRKNK